MWQRMVLQLTEDAVLKILLAHRESNYRDVYILPRFLYPGVTFTMCFEIHSRYKYDVALLLQLLITYRRYGDLELFMIYLLDNYPDMFWEVRWVPHDLINTQFRESLLHILSSGKGSLSTKGVFLLWLFVAMNRYGPIRLQEGHIIMIGRILTQLTPDFVRTLFYVLTHSRIKTVNTSVMMNWFRGILIVAAENFSCIDSAHPSYLSNLIDTIVIDIKLWREHAAKNCGMLDRRLGKWPVVSMRQIRDALVYQDSNHVYPGNRITVTFMENALAWLSNCDIKSDDTPTEYIHDIITVLQRTEFTYLIRGYTASVDKIRKQPGLKTFYDAFAFTLSSSLSGFVRLARSSHEFDNMKTLETIIRYGVQRRSALYELLDRNNVPLQTLDYILRYV